MAALATLFSIVWSIVGLVVAAYLVGVESCGLTLWIATILAVLCLIEACTCIWCIDEALAQYFGSGEEACQPPPQRPESPGTLTSVVPAAPFGGALSAGQVAVSV
mmetsp:Transcript_69880/g.202531  ORF Transcript_69880/g.202531 Transcript_69880/m.202531 type:complete len:105 (+) Transcript_69880:1-315(+)